MPDYTADIDRLLREAEGMDLSPTQLALLEEAVRLADLHNDIDLGIEIRTFLMYVARNLLRGDVLTTAFVWNLAQCDRAPERFRGRNLLTEYRWVIGQLANTDTVSRAKLEELLADYEKRLQAGGFSRRNYCYAQRSLATDLGDRAVVMSAHQEFHQHPRDGLCVSRAWELGEDVLVECWLGNFERALNIAQPLLEDGAMGHEYPEQIWAYLLLPMLKAGQADRAKRLLTRCLSRYRPEKCHYWWHGEMLTIAALTNDLGRACKLYERCQRALHRLTEPLTYLHFALDALFFLDCLKVAGKDTLSLLLPDNVPVPRANGAYPVAGLRDWYESMAVDLTARFDARNGNSYFQEERRQRAELFQWALTQR